MGNNISKKTEIVLEDITIEDPDEECLNDLSFVEDKGSAFIRSASGFEQPPASASSLAEVIRDGPVVHNSVIDHDYDKYITLAICALHNLRETPDIDNDIKDFAIIVIEIIKQMENWENLEQLEMEYLSTLLYAFEEWEKTNFSTCSRMMYGNIRYMMSDLVWWCKNKCKEENKDLV